MDAKVFLHALAAWATIAVGAILNGIFRESVLIPAMGAGRAGLASMGILLAVIVAVAAFVVTRRPWRRMSSRGLLAVGISWAAGSIAFEFVLGLAILGMSLAEVLSKYDMLSGELWPLAPATMAVAPLLAARAFARMRASERGDGRPAPVSPRRS